MQRHRIAHEYDALDNGIIWSVANKYVPELIDLIEPLLAKYDTEAGPNLDENTP